MKGFSKEDGYKVNALPIFWYKKAAELRYAAELLFPHSINRINRVIEAVKKDEIDFSTIEPDTFGTYMALLGYSIECLLKGIIIKKNPSFVSNGVLPGKLKTHDLIKLANMADIKLSNNEKVFCEQSFKEMTVNFRYPVPSKAEEPDNISTIGGNCTNVFTELFDRFYPDIKLLYRFKK